MKMNVGNVFPVNLFKYGIQEMIEIARVILIINILIVLITMILASIYLLPIIFVRRFYTPMNILTGNFVYLEWYIVSTGLSLIFI
jgi:hypothetical protein